MGSFKEYYETYWSGEAPPDTDPLTPARLRILLDRLPPNSHILDVGCGRGRCARTFATAGHRVTGIDISERAVNEARRLVPEGRFYVQDLSCALPFPDSHFDAVYMADVIEHLFDARPVLRELSRILKAGGELLVSTPYHGLVKNLFIALFRFDSHFDPLGPHIRFFSRKTLARVLVRSGFLEPSFVYLGRFSPIWKNMVAVARKP